jgi:8-amino-7-oxononanoate synthase
VTGTRWHDWLEETAKIRGERDLTRQIVARTAEDGLLNLASNDYLGLSRDPSVVEAAITAVRTWGAGATGSRLVTGTTDLHVELECELAEFTGAEAALVFASGYAANIAVVTSLGTERTLVVSDAGNHASLIDGCRLAAGRVVVTPHRDVAAVRDALAHRRESRAMVVTDAIFSVDGEPAPLAELANACADYDAALVVDEAHALGVVGPGGRGLVADMAVRGDIDLIRTVTLSKALGSQGGAVLASRQVIDHLVDTARTFVFDTGLAPAAVGAAVQALRLLRAQPQLPDRAVVAAAMLARALDIPAPAAAIVSLRVAQPGRALAAARHCAARGVRVGCLRPPTVPDDRSRLRMAASATLTIADIDLAATTVRESLVAVKA